MKQFSNKNKKKIVYLITVITFCSFVLTPLINATTHVIQGQTKNLQNTPGLRNDWWDQNWLYRKEILINHTMTMSDLSNFPILFTIIDTDLAAKAQQDGDDIVFTDEQAEKLNHEIEYYNATTGNLVAWIQIPLLNSSDDTILYMYYGNQNSGNQQNIQETWDLQYLAVHHLEEISGNITDSTINHNDGIPYGNITQNVEGKIDGADFFDGIDDHILLPQIYSNETQFTLEAWIYPQTGARYFVSQWNNYKGVLLQVGANPDHVEWYIDGTSGNITGITLNTWYYIVLTYNGTTAKIYKNAGTPNSKACAVPTWPAEGLYIGDRSAGSRQFHGIIDEVRLSNVTRDGNWIAACYNNQNDSSKYYTIGYEETIPNTPPEKPDDPVPQDNAVDVPVNPTLSVHVVDTDNDTMNVSFYDASDNSLIDTDINVANDSRAEITWTGLEYKTTYTWYAVANDSTSETASDTWSFTTKSNQTIPPTVSIIKPKEKSLYFRDHRLIVFPKTLIIGFITITAEAHDDTGIKEVQFYIDETLKNTTYTPGDGGFYSWTWNDRSWIRSRHTITVKVIDTDDNEVQASLAVSLRNFPLLHPLKP
jgi:hypothetical protein